MANGTPDQGRRALSENRVIGVRYPYGVQSAASHNIYFGPERTSVVMKAALQNRCYSGQSTEINPPWRTCPPNRYPPQQQRPDQLIDECSWKC